MADGNGIECMRAILRLGPLFNVADASVLQQPDNSRSEEFKLQQRQASENLFKEYERLEDYCMIYAKFDTFHI